MENIEPKLEKIADLEEKIYFERENLNKLENKSKIFEMTREIIENSYLEMKNNITPKFNNNLSKYIEKTQYSWQNKNVFIKQVVIWIKQKLII